MSSTVVQVQITVPTFPGWKFDRVGQPDRTKGERYVNDHGLLVQPTFEPGSYTCTCLVYVKEHEYRRAEKDDGIRGLNGDVVKGRMWWRLEWVPCLIIGISAYCASQIDDARTMFWCVLTDDTHQFQKEVISSTVVEVLVERKT